MDDLRADPDVLNKVLENSREYINHVDMQNNILIGLGTAIFAFSVSQFHAGQAAIPFIFLGFFSALSSIVGLMAVHPPRSMRKHGQEESLLYDRRGAEFISPEVYQRQLEKMLGNREALVGEYAKEIYNMAKYSYGPKRRLFKLSRNILITGIAASFAMAVFTLL